jgi:anthranilate phosphoribosyltransferase
VFLFAPVFHPAMKHIAPIRRELGCRTVFNILGPIINPVDYSISEGLEARVLGVGKTELGEVYAETLKLLGVKNALVVCGEEELDEVSIAGLTKCWWVKGEVIETFKIHPTETFGVGCHQLKEVAGGKGPRENAVLLEKLLKGGMERGEPVRDFVTVNAAALVVVAGAVEGGEEVGVDGIIRGERWRRAVEVVDGALADGGGWRAWEKFRDVSRKEEEEERQL